MKQNFAKSLKIVQGYSKLHRRVKACVMSY